MRIDPILSMCRTCRGCLAIPHRVCMPQRPDRIVRRLRHHEHWRINAFWATLDTLTKIQKSRFCCLAHADNGGMGAYDHVIYSKLVGLCIKVIL